MFSSADLECFARDGFVLKEGLFEPDYVQQLKSTVDEVAGDNRSVNRSLERDESTVRSVYGAHVENDDLLKLSKGTELVQMAMQLVGAPVHVFQFKLNVKRALIGAGWEWHQDYTYFHKEDGMPLPRCVNAVVFLDDVTEFNGPVTLIPGSHREFFGITPGEGRTAEDEKAGPWSPSPGSGGSRYKIPVGELQRMARSNSLVAPKGAAGSVLFFHVNTVHGSAANMSPFDRSLVLVTYNSVENAPQGGRRPGYIASSDTTPILDASWLPKEHLDRALVV